MNKIQFSKEDIQFIIDKYQSNEMTTLELGEYFHCSRSTIERRLKENNIQLKQVYKYKDLTNQVFNHLTVIKENKERYVQDKEKTNKPHRYWFCQCDCGNTNLIEVESSHLINGHTTSCGCIKSLGEQAIKTLLLKNNINFKSEYTFPDLFGIGGKKLRYDFAIFNDQEQISHLIEYNGKQHYIQNGGWNSKEEFEARHQNDLLKIEYAKRNNIPLIIIPYTVPPKNITLEKILIREEVENL